MTVLSLSQTTLRSTRVTCQKKGCKKIIQQEQTSSLVAQGNFLSTEDLPYFFAFHENIKSEIHEKMQCNRCPTFNGSPNTEAESIKRDSESDEETSDIDGFSEIAGCLQNLKRSEKQVKMVKNNINDYSKYKSMENVKLDKPKSSGHVRLKHGLKKAWELRR
ncbi:hypothetical protein VNO78_21429 [Psophocarpus tetragonolobus]|uniref:Uncharacterized protein n=1 Tax=Psophocarpus tetragonolobus TaxID=3891 RepID=A0AAN9XI44_PSOTE